MPPNSFYITFVPETPLMADTLSKTIYRQLFSDAEWDLIYNSVGYALDDDEEEPEIVYSIYNKIHAIFDEEN
jgi:hypothetical protein